MLSIKDNEIWSLVDLPPYAKTLGSKWLFKKKTDMDGNTLLLFSRYWIYYLKISAICFSSGITLPQQGNLSSLAVGKSSGSGNSSLVVGMP
nr:putative zinc finger, CCHC-type [Tanacetum cinerariifolium]